MGTIALVSGQQADEQALIEFCRGKIGKWELPKRVLFVNELPKGATGKIAKFQIRESL